MHSRNPRLAIFFFALILIASGFAGAVYAQHAGSDSSTDSELRDNLKTFSQIYSLVEQNYAETVKPDKAIYDGAIPGMLHVLDPHSNFFDPKQYAQLREDQSGKYFGVGMQVGPRNNRVIVIAPFAGTPAYKAGIRPGDIIIAVDGKSTDNMTTADVADLLKGPRNTNVRITVTREGADKPIDFNVVRDEIPRHSVDAQFEIRPGIGYMHISSFQETTGEEVAQTLDGFGNLQGLILDLRQNPGGVLSEAVAVADKFLEKGQVIVSHHGRASAERIYRASNGNGGKEYPIVVLVNRGSASASEIVAGALQDHDRAIIAGETTFGKGLVQTVYPLSDNTGLALTTAHYYTPSGRLIQRNYTGLSLYDYYYNNRDDKTAPSTADREVKTTDSGRKVYGGGGINPDVQIPTPKLDRFQTLLYQKYAFFNFAKKFMENHKPDRTFNVNDDVMQDFRKFLEAEKIDYTEPDLTANADWLKSNIKSEIFTAQFGQEAGQRVLREADPEVARALELLPQAKALNDGARKTVAERTAGRNAVTNR
jgi:carboxyl-terminal processing protease